MYCHTIQRCTQVHRESSILYYPLAFVLTDNWCGIIVIHLVYCDMMHSSRQSMWTIEGLNCSLIPSYTPVFALQMWFQAVELMLAMMTMLTMVLMLIVMATMTSTTNILRIKLLALLVLNDVYNPKPYSRWLIIYIILYDIIYEVDTGYNDDDISIFIYGFHKLIMMLLLPDGILMWYTYNRFCVACSWNIEKHCKALEMLNIIIWRYESMISSN